MICTIYIYMYVNSNNVQTVLTKILLNCIWQNITAKFLPVFLVKLALPDH